MRRKAAEQAAESSSGDAARVATGNRCSKTWAMLIKRVYEFDPMTCPRCSGQMNVVAFLEPPQRDVIDKILQHCGLMQASEPRGPPDQIGLVHNLETDVLDQTPDLTFIDIDTFLATF